MSSLKEAIIRRWYNRPGLLFLLMPMELLYRLIMKGRRLAYGRNWLPVVRFPVPILVVGNITVGGTGKTPLVAAITEHLKADGWHPAIVSRGYGGEFHGVQAVTAHSTAVCVGDEPLLLSRRTGVPVYVGAKRVEVVRQLLKDHPEVTVIISDDGLQHLSMARDLDIVVVDAQRQFGNAHLLPVGPLREPLHCLQSTLVIYHGSDAQIPASAHRMRLVALPPVAVTPGDCVGEPILGKGAQRISAWAGIGNPDRFFNQLALEGYTVHPVAKPDHHQYSEEDFANLAEPILMTEKDAVKCAGLAPPGSAFIPVEAAVSLGVWLNIRQALRKWRETYAG